MAINRAEPNGPVNAYQTFRMTAPLATHHRPASCEEVLCQQHAHGFKVITDPTTDLGRRQEAYIRSDRSRPMPAWTTRRDGLREATYPAGTTCYHQHTVPTWRAPLCVVRAGDWRGNPTGERRPLHVTDWLDAFGTHQQDLADRLDPRRGA